MRQRLHFQGRIMDSVVSGDQLPGQFAADLSARARSQLAVSVKLNPFPQSHCFPQSQLDRNLLFALRKMESGMHETHLTMDLSSVCPREQEAKQKPGRILVEIIDFAHF
jgi:hypothetical protein